MWKETFAGLEGSVLPSLGCLTIPDGRKDCISHQQLIREPKTSSRKHYFSTVIHPAMALEWQASPIVFGYAARCTRHIHRCIVPSRFALLTLAHLFGESLHAGRACP